MRKIIHVSTLDVRAGGVPRSTYTLAKGQRMAGWDASVFMFALPDESYLIGNEVPYHTTPPPRERRFAYSSRFRKDLKKLGPPAVYHAHGVWQYLTYAMVDMAKKQQIPYLISPRGMLYPEDIKKSNRFLKHLSLRWRLLRDLNGAVCVHATCRQEMEHLRALGITSPIAVIPNAVEIPTCQLKRQDRLFRVGYMGRLDPRKNIDGLIEIWGKLDTSVKDSELLIIGDGSPDYVNYLKKRAGQLHTSNVCFSGLLTGRAKEEALASLSLLVMPSEFENFGNVIAEGLIRGIPCIATNGSPWEGLVTHDCGWWIDHSQDALRQTLEIAITTPYSELREMGNRAYHYAISAFSVESVAKQFDSLYGWILGSNTTPSFLYTSPGNNGNLDD